MGADLKNFILANSNKHSILILCSTEVPLDFAIPVFRAGHRVSRPCFEDPFYIPGCKVFVTALLDAQLCSCLPMEIIKLKIFNSRQRDKILRTTCSGMVSQQAK